MAKIFISFFNGIQSIDPNTRDPKIPCFYESFIEELRSIGNELFVYCHQNNREIENQIPSGLLSRIQAFAPDIIILFNNSFYDVSHLFECPIIIYEVDSVFYYSNKENIIKNPSRYKFIVPQTVSITVLQETLGIDRKNICYIPFFTSVKTENIAQNINISFIGSKFIHSKEQAAWSLFQHEKPSWAEIRQFNQIIQEIGNNPFIKSEQLIDKYNIKSQNILKHLDIQNIIWMLSNSNRIQTLSEVADLGLELYGSETWGTDLQDHPEVALSYKNQQVYSLEHNQGIYNRSKICININHIQAKTGFSWRVCDIMASNACLVSEYKSDFSVLFPNVDIPTFTNKFEAREQCIKLLNNDNMRLDIAAQCQEIINEKYRFEHMLEKLEGFIGENLQSNSLHDIEKYILEIGPRVVYKEKRSFVIGLELVIYSILFVLSTLPGLSLFLEPSKFLNKIKRKATKN